MKRYSLDELKAMSADKIREVPAMIRLAPRTPPSPTAVEAALQQVVADTRRNEVHTMKIYPRSSVTDYLAEEAKADRQQIEAAWQQMRRDRELEVTWTGIGKFIGAVLVLSLLFWAYAWVRAL